MTEIGRRTALLTGTTAFAISMLLGIWLGDLIEACLFGLAAAFIFGVGGMMVGNLIDGYVHSAVHRELSRQALEHELERELMASKIQEKKKNALQKPLEE